MAECLAGAELHATEATDQSLLITIVCKASHHGSRILAVMFNNKDGRNFMLNGLRYLHAFLLINTLLSSRDHD